MPKFATTLYLIDAPHFCAGIEVSNGHVTNTTAPILAYMQGWTFNRVIRYAETKDWSVEICPINKSKWKDPK
jgi:hypothetical protein